jgi:enamine deaminase RidA (YjgF/YER057c/UK114 family)
MRVTSFAIAAAVALALVFLPDLSASKKKKKKDDEPATQTLPVLKDPPLALTAETERLVYRVAPLSGKGLLSAQVRDALKALMRENHGVIVKLRAFVAGTGDMRRVGTIVSEVFADKKQPLPIVSTLQAGALPLEGAQVVIESVAVERKAVNPHGVAFLKAMPMEQVQSVLGSLGLSGMRVLRATCYLPSLDTHAQARAAVAAAFPAAAVDLVQMQRLPVNSPMMCETVASLERRPSQPVEFRDSSRAVLVSTPQVVITGTQLAFRSQDADLKLAFDRLGRTLESMQTSYSKVVVAHIYPLADDVAAKVQAREFEYFSKNRVPVISSILMEGLPSVDASFAVEVIAVP